MFLFISGDYYFYAVLFSKWRSKYNYEYFNVNLQFFISVTFKSQHTDTNKIYDTYLYNYRIIIKTKDIT